MNLSGFDSQLSRRGAAVDLSDEGIFAVAYTQGDTSTALQDTNIVAQVWDIDSGFLNSLGGSIANRLTNGPQENPAILILSDDTPDDHTDNVVVLAWGGQTGQSDEGVYFRRFGGGGNPLHDDALQRSQASNVALASFNEGTSFLLGVQEEFSNQPDEYVIFASDGAVDAFNRAPDGADFVVDGIEDTPYVFTLSDFTDNFDDLEDDPLAGIRITSLPTDGILMFGGSAASVGDFVGSSQLTAGQLVFVPDLNFDGTSSFDFVVNDGNRDSFFTNTATLEIDAVNDAPQFSLTFALEIEQGSANNVIGPGNLEVTDVDDDDGSLNLEIRNGPTFGTVLNNGVEVQPGALIPYADFVAGLITYAHDGNNAGNDSIQFALTDGGEDLPPGTNIETTFFIDVSPTQQQVAVPDLFEIPEDTVLSGVDANGVEANLLANDSIASGSFSINTTPVVGPANGSLTINPDGTFVYTPDQDFFGEDRFIYEVSDGNVTSRAVVTITVTSVEDAPVAGADSFTIDEDSVLSGAMTDLFVNDRDGDSDPLTINTTPVSGPSNGSLTINADGTFIYTPNENFNGEDQFEYEISDGDLTSRAVVTITVTSVEDAPVAGADRFIIDEDSVLSGTMTNLLDIADDAESDPLTINTTPVSGPNNGSLTINADGTFIYRPNENFNGTDSFVYEITDDGGLSGTARVEIVVNPVDDLSVGIDFSEDFIVGDDLFDLIVSNAIDIDSRVDGAVILSQPENGDVFVNTNGELVFEPDDDEFEGQVVFRYAPVSLGQVGQAADATLNVIQVGGVPVPSPDVEDEDRDNSEPDPQIDPTVGMNVSGNDNTGSSEDGEIGNVDIFQEIGGNFRRPNDLNRSGGLDFSELEFDSDGDLIATYAYLSNVDNVESSYERILERKTNSSSEGEVLFAQGFFDELDSAKYQFVVDFDFTFPSIAAAGTSFLAVGYLAWMVRGGVLLTTFMSSIPAWRMLDPLAVLESTDGSGDDGDGQSIGELVDS